MPDYKINQAGAVNGWGAGVDTNDGLSVASPKLTWANAHALRVNGDTFEFNSDGSTDYLFPGMTTPITMAANITAAYADDVYVFPEFSYNVNTQVIQTLPPVTVNQSFIPQSEVDSANGGGPITDPTSAQIANALAALGITDGQGLYYNGTDDASVAATNYYSVAGGVVTEVQAGGNNSRGIIQPMRG